jgi:hypothetical protein
MLACKLLLKLFLREHTNLMLLGCGSTIISDRRLDSHLVGPNIVGLDASIVSRRCMTIPSRKTSAFLVGLEHYRTGVVWQIFWKRENEMLTSI